MMSQIKFELYDNDKIIKTILTDSNPTNISEFMNSLECFGLEVNKFLSDSIEANGVPDDTDGDDDSLSEEEVVQPVCTKKRKK